MMLHGASGRAILTKSVEDRWRGELIATSILGVFLLGGLAAYRQIDLSIYTDMPVAIRAVMHVPDGADVAALAYGVIYSFIAAMTLAGLAVSMGASTIAGEERDGTLGLLLANPTTRSHVLRAKIVAMVTVTSIGALLLLVAARIAPAVAGVAIGSSDLVALMVHMWANALVFGFLAVAIGAWTGNRSLASACSAGIMVLSYFAVGLLPLSASLAGLAKFFPWYWFDGGAPMAQGINGRHLLLEAATIGLCVTFAFIGLNRRDLRRGGAGGIATLVDRLRANPSTKKVMDRLAGQARVSHIWVKAASERQGLLVIASVAMFAMMGIMMGIMYAAIDDALATMS